MFTHTTAEQRKEFYRRHQQGESYRELAAETGVSMECVRYWCRRQRDGGGCQSCYPGRPHGLLQEFDGLVRYWILRLRLKHPRWGSGSLRIHLKKQPSLSGKRLPALASIGRYLHQWPRFHRKAKKKPVIVRPQQATQVHECWQIDFKVAIPLRDGTLVDLHTVRDPIGEVCIAAILYRTELAQVLTGRVPMEQVRATLRTAFAHWHTLPNIVQTDGEPCLSPPREDSFPSTFSLWLKGLDVEHRLIRPGKPTDNAEVERCHRTINEYAIVGNEDNPLPHLQVLLDQAIFELAYELPSRAEGCAGKTPIQAHPELLQPRRPFCAQEELAQFDLQRVDIYLATFTWQRKVSHTGQICIGGHHHYYTVGHAYAGLDVLVRFDPSDRHFVFFELETPEKEVGRRPARHLEVQDLTGYATFPQSFLPQQLPLPLFQGVNSL
jgi:transposase InsO family protein